MAPKVVLALLCTHSTAYPLIEGCSTLQRDLQPRPFLSSIYLNNYLGLPKPKSLLPCDLRLDALPT